jgi:hypothetical protein
MPITTVTMLGLRLGLIVRRVVGGTCTQIPTRHERLNRRRKP